MIMYLPMTAKVLSLPEQKTLRLQCRFRTLAEAGKIARLLSGYYPDPLSAYYGLNELMLNAVEHGNLGIGAEKARLIQEGLWREEIERRLTLNENAEKFVHVTLEADATQVCVWIRDQG